MTHTHTHQRERERERDGDTATDSQQHLLTAASEEKSAKPILGRHAY